MISVKSFSASPTLQIQSVLTTGIPSKSLLRRIEGSSPNRSIERILKESNISFDPVPITDFKIQSLQEIFDWADQIESSLYVKFSDLPELIKRRNSSTKLVTVIPGRVRQKEGPEPRIDISSVTISLCRSLLQRVREFQNSHSDWRYMSVKKCREFLAQEVFKGISLTLGDYLELGTPRKPIYHAVMNDIVSGLKSDLGNWQKPWSCSQSVTLPRNVKTYRPYSGFNIIWLWQVARSHSYSTNLWGTRLQWEQLGASVTVGEVATPAFKFFPIVSSVAAGGIRVGIVPIYNSAQVVGWRPRTKKGAQIDPVDRAEKLVRRVGPDIRPSTSAYFLPSDDFIGMPPIDTFFTTEGYYGTLLHELVHWTGHSTRENREFGHRGSAEYAKEELVAELGAAFLCADLGITHNTPPDHAQYIKSWIQELSRKNRTLIWAAAKASRAIDFMKAASVNRQEGKKTTVV